MNNTVGTTLTSALALIAGGIAFCVVAPDSMSRVFKSTRLIRKLHEA